MPITWSVSPDGGEARSACGLFGVYLIPEGYVGIVNWWASDMDISDPHPTLADAQRWCEEQLHQPAEAPGEAKVGA
jgi:hypothetical protein